MVFSQTEHFPASAELMAIHKTLLCQSHRCSESGGKGYDWSTVQSRYLQDHHRNVRLRKQYVTPISRKNIPFPIYEVSCLCLHLSSVVRSVRSVDLETQVQNDKLKVEVHTCRINFVCH